MTSQPSLPLEGRGETDPIREALNLVLGRVLSLPEMVGDPNQPPYSLVIAETAHGLPLTYLGVRTEAILNADGVPGRRRRFHVFTDEPR